MASNESEDARSSMVASDSDDVNASNDSALMNKPKRPSRSGTVFRAWSLQVTVNADLSQGASTQDKAMLLTEHLSNRTAHSIKTSFISVSTFCDESQLSRQPDSSGLVSILIRGYVQTKQATLQNMQTNMSIICYIICRKICRICKKYVK